MKDAPDPSPIPDLPPMPGQRLARGVARVHLVELAAAFAVADEFAVDPARVGVVGFSAGGNGQVAYTVNTQGGL